ncbi:MAG: hypothetical protein ACXWX1_04760 [Aeromicrobium sp.]
MATTVSDGPDSGCDSNTAAAPCFGLQGVSEGVALKGFQLQVDRGFVRVQGFTGFRFGHRRERDRPTKPQVSQWNIRM